MCGMAAPPNADAFALLGPYAPWMTPELGYHQLGDIGGPMAMGEGYRWNVPVLSYGFDQSFINYFGPAGIAAVEQAIQIINNLPPASSIALSNYSSATTRINYVAQQESLYDLTSITLPALLSELGLAPPTESSWTLRHWDANSCQWVYFTYYNYKVYPESSAPEISGIFDPYYVLQRNYDPYSLQLSTFVNGILYDFLIYSTSDCSSAFVRLDGAPPLNPASPAICDNEVGFSTPGYCYLGLTRDDVGGIAYLLNRTNICVESLDEYCFAPPRSTNALVRTAPRPGVEKISFIPHPTDAAGNFLVLSNRFADIYVNNGLLTTQTVQRVTSRPDFIFSARDFGAIYYPQYTVVGGPLPCQPQDTSQWINNSALNGTADGLGPGNIRGPVEIAFHTPGKYVAAAGGTINSNAGNLWNWGSFSAPSTNIVIYPGNQTNLTSLTLSLQIQTSNGPPVLAWTVLGHQDAVYNIDTSIDLTNWLSAGSITNTNGIFQFTYPLDQPQRYFRAVLR